MDCSQTEGGWFEVKAFVTNGAGWEGDINQVASCKSISAHHQYFYDPDFDLRAHYKSSNHMAMCGYINVFEFGANSCTIDPLM